MSAINTEFGRGNDLGSYRGTVWYTAAGGSGTFTSTNLGFDQFYGKQLASPSFSFAISANQTNANLRSLAVSAGWNQSSTLTATINGGIYISSNGTGTPALTINGSFPGGVTLVNNGFIVGAGGNGGAGSGLSNTTAISGAAGAGGGVALSVSVGVTINNASGTIAGGGGGGGGGKGGGYFEADPYDSPSLAGGGGGGGGRSSVAVNSSGGGGGPAFFQFAKQGFVAPGSAGGAGTVSSQGSGGVGGTTGGGVGGFTGGFGGSGGGWGAGGGTGGSGSPNSPNAYQTGPFSGGGGGNAVVGNGNISWAAFGTRLGGIS
jgi:hypothetical protein